MKNDAGSRSGKYREIFEETPCLTAEQLLGYAAGTLTADDLHRVEKHLVDCEICSDALEGVLEADIERFRAGLADINREIRRDTGLEKDGAGWKTYFSIAAVFVAALVTTFFFLREEPNEALFTQYYEPYPSTVPIVREESDKTPLELAMAQYELGQYDEARRALKNIVATDPGNQTAVFFTGSSELAVGQPEAAIVYFEKILEAPDSLLKNPAEWYLALAYIRLNRLERAAVVLERIVDGQGFYKQRAQAILEELKEISE